MLWINSIAVRKWEQITHQHRVSGYRIQGLIYVELIAA
jgi:hypothetical protein